MLSGRRTSQMVHGNPSFIATYINKIMHWHEGFLSFIQVYFKHSIVCMGSLK